MNTRLILLVDEHWPARPALPWVLVDDAGRTLSEGSSEPRHWPAAAECAVVLAGSQCAWHRARLPRGARREEGRLLAYALEDQLLRDPDSQHLVTTSRENNEEGVTLRVLVTARERLRHVVAQLAAIGRPPVAVWSELQCAPASAAGWHLAKSEAHLILRSGPQQGEVLDPPLAAALPLLQHALAQARAANRAPATLTLHLAAGQLAPDPAELQALALDCETGPAYEWWQAQAATNLLQGEFASRHQRDGWFARLRWPLRLATASLAILLAANVGQVLWQRHQLADLEARMARLFQTAVPNTPAIAPAAQLRRQLDDQRARHGRLREDDLLALLSAYGEARGVEARDSLRGLRYSAGQLQLDLAALAPDEAAELGARLAARGFRTRSQEDPPQLTIAAELAR